MASKGNKRRRRLWGLFVICTAIAILLFVATSNLTSVKSGTGHPQSIPALLASDYENPATASKYGVAGYVEVSLLNTTGSVDVSASREADFALAVRFISYSADLVSVNVSFGQSGILEDQYYPILGPDGQLVGRGVVHINDLISYEPQGVISVPVGTTQTVNLVLRIPSDFPDGLHDFSLGPLGISVDGMNSIPVVASWSVSVHV